MTGEQPAGRRPAPSQPGNDATPPIKAMVPVNHLDDGVHADVFQALIHPGAGHRGSNRQPIGRNEYVDFEQFIATTCTDVYRALSGRPPRSANQLH